MTKDQQRVRCDARMPKRFPKGEPQPGSLAGAQCTLPKGHDGDHTVLPWIGMSCGDSGKDTPMTKDTPDPVAGETVEAMPVRERIGHEVMALKALIGTCESDLHRSLVGCPHCQRDERHLSILEAADKALASAHQLAEQAERLRQTAVDELIKMGTQRDALTRENAALTRLCADRDHYAEEVQALTREAEALREAQDAVVEELHRVVAMSLAHDKGGQQVGPMFPGRMPPSMARHFEKLLAALPAPPPAPTQEGQ